MLFDENYYIEINEARWKVAEKILDSIDGHKTCLDAGCGPGWFASRLVSRGLNVYGVDGRDDLLDIARKRAPEAEFSKVNIENKADTHNLPICDLVLCFGLLYHLENPFAAIRNLRRCAGKHMLIETQVTSDLNPTFQLVSEGENETQGLTFHAVIPSRSSMIKMLYLAGFSSVQRYNGVVDHPDFADTTHRRRRREVFVAGITPISHPDLVSEIEPQTPKIDYSR